MHLTSSLRRLALKGDGVHGCIHKARQASSMGKGNGIHTVQGSLGIWRSRVPLRMPGVKSKTGTGAKFTNNAHSGFTEAVFLLGKMCKCWEELLGEDMTCIYC